MRVLPRVTFQEAKLIALVSLAMRVLPLECAATPGLSSRLTVLLQGRIDSLECTLRDVRASQGIALLHGLESSVLFLRDQLEAVVGACGGLEQDVDDLSTEIEELRSKAAYDSEQITWLQESLAVASRSAAAQQEMSMRAQEELVRLRESFRRNPSEPEGLRAPAAATARRPLPVAGHRTIKRNLPALPSTGGAVAPTAPVTLRDDTQRGQCKLAMSPVPGPRHHSGSDYGADRGTSPSMTELNAPVTVATRGVVTGCELLVILAQAAACDSESSEVPTASLSAPRGTSTGSVDVGHASHTHAPQAARTVGFVAGSDAAIEVRYDSGPGAPACADSVHASPLSVPLSSLPLASDALAISPIPSLATSPHWHLHPEPPLSHPPEGSESDEDAVRGRQLLAADPLAGPCDQSTEAEAAHWQSRSHGGLGLLVRSEPDSESAMMVIVTSGPYAALAAAAAGPDGGGWGPWSSSTDSLRALHDEPLAAPLARRAGPPQVFPGGPTAGIIGRGAAGSASGSRVVLPAEAAPLSEARALPLQPAGGGKQSRAAPGSSTSGVFSRAVLWI